MDTCRMYPPASQGKVEGQEEGAGCVRGAGRDRVLARGGAVRQQGASPEMVLGEEVLNNTSGGLGKGVGSGGPGALNVAAGTSLGPEEQAPPAKALASCSLQSTMHVCLEEK